jgi:glucose/mannose-6-phosphate isomerase
MSTGTGRVLEDATALERMDPGTMLAKIGRFPDQMRAAWEITRSLELPERYRNATAVAVLGMGGSAVSGDLVRTIFGDRLTVPIATVRDYILPAWAGPTTLVVAVSHSGATEETISALGTALERRCPVAVITTGGPIGEVAAHVDLPRLTYPNEAPPRASVGYLLILLAGLLERAGMLELTGQEVDEAADAARSVVRSCWSDIPTDSNMAKQLAWSLLDRLPVIVGSGAMAAVARRWKTQLNENANSAAMAEELPEATHNAIVGYEQPETLRDHQYHVFLAAPGDHPRNRRRARLSTDLLNAVGIAHRRISFEGPSRLAQACAAISLGDFVSFYLAVVYGVDPSSTPALSMVKAHMSEFDPMETED